jgi:hypothetical protein
MSRISFLGKHAPAALIVLFVAWAMPSGAFAELIGFEVLEWKQDLTGTMRVDQGSITGTEEDLQDDLGLEVEDTLTQWRAWLRITEHQSILASHLESNRTGRATLTSPLVFGGVAFAPGDTIKSRLELRQDSLLWRYDFIASKVFKFGVPFGAGRLRLSSEVESEVSGLSGDGGDVGTIPVVGLGFSFEPFPIFHVAAEAEGMNIHLNGNAYRVYDARGQVEIHFAPFIGLNLGYRKGVADVEMGDLGKADLEFNGPFATLTFRF